jgi:selenocysteine-specific translation elongation factor
VKLLGRVEAVFTVAGRGTVIVPLWLSDSKARNGDAIQLRNANNRSRDTRILAVELLKEQGKGCRVALMLPIDVAKGEIEVGTEIWVDDSLERSGNS